LNSFRAFPCPRTASTAVSTLSLHDALPISMSTTASQSWPCSFRCSTGNGRRSDARPPFGLLARSGAPLLLRPSASNIAKYMRLRSEEHTSELQSRENLVCRLLLEKKKNKEV